MSEVLSKVCATCPTPVGCRITKICTMEGLQHARQQEQEVPPQVAAGAAPQVSAPAEAPAGNRAPPVNVTVELKLCRNCRHAERPIGQGIDWAKCEQKEYPINLITGSHKFPCIIARGYSELCGFEGRFWERK